MTIYSQGYRSTDETPFHDNSNAHGSNSSFRTTCSTDTCHNTVPFHQSVTRDIDPETAPYEEREFEYDSFGRIVKITNRQVSGNMAKFSLSKKRRTPNDMSFVGILVKSDRIIGIADSKSTQVKRDGTLQHKGETKKLFHNDDIIIVTHGGNRIRTLTPDGSDKLEYWVQDNIELFRNPSEAARALQQRRNIADSSDINFLTGRYEGNLPVITNISVKPDEIQCKETTPQIMQTGYPDEYAYFAYGGTEEYLKAMGKIDSEVLSKLDEKSLKEMIESLVRYHDYADVYNPVGLPIETYTIHKPKT